LFFSKDKLNRVLIVLVALSIGALLGGAVFHLIPEGYEELGLGLTILLTGLGILVFFGIEKLLHWHHCHKSKECKIHPFSYLILYGDAVHNFVDGLIIASSFLVSTEFGVITSLLIISHELPQELGDFGVLIYGGFSKKKALFYNFLSQLTSVLGGILGFYFLSLHDFAIYLLPFAAGGFLYIALNDLFPEVFSEKNRSKRWWNILAIIIGLGILISAKIFGE
jgi:zinc and cadmium transporter